MFWNLGRDEKIYFSFDFIFIIKQFLTLDINKKELNPMNKYLDNMKMQNSSLTFES